MVGLGPLAMILCEPGQARKGAAAADDSCAGMWLGPATQSPHSSVRFDFAWSRYFIALSTACSTFISICCLSL